MLSHPPVLLRLLQMGAVTKDYQHGRTRIGDRPCKTARWPKRSSITGKGCVLRGHEWGAGSGELLNEEAWGGGNVSPVSDAPIPVSYGTDGHSQPPRPWLWNAVSELNAKNIKWSSRSRLSTISYGQIGEVAKSCILKQIWTKCSYCFEVKRANCRKEDCSAWNNTARLKAYSTELGR